MHPSVYEPSKAHGRHGERRHDHPPVSPRVRCSDSTQVAVFANTTTAFFSTFFILVLQHCND